MKSSTVLNQIFNFFKTTNLRCYLRKKSCVFNKLLYLFIRFHLGCKYTSCGFKCSTFLPLVVRHVQIYGVLALVCRNNRISHRFLNQVHPHFHWLTLQKQFLILHLVKTLNLILLNDPNFTRGLLFPNTWYYTLLREEFWLGRLNCKNIVCDTQVPFSSRSAFDGKLL